MANIFQQLKDQLKATYDIITNRGGARDMLTNNPDLQQVALHLSERPKELSRPVNVAGVTVPKAVPDMMGMLESEAFGAGRGALTNVVQLGNLFNKLGGRISGINAPNIKQTALADYLLPESSMSAFGKNTEREYGMGGRDIGKTAYDTAMFYALSNAIATSPAVAPLLQKGYTALKPLTESTKFLPRTFGAGLANVVEGLPYTAALQLRRSLEEDSPLYKLIEGKGSLGEIAGEQAGSALFDLGLGAVAANLPGFLKNLGYSGMVKPQIKPQVNLPAGYDMPFDPRMRAIVEEAPPEILNNLAAIEKAKPGDYIPGLSPAPIKPGANTPGISPIPAKPIDYPEPLMTARDKELPINQSTTQKILNSLKKMFAPGNSEAGFINFGAEVGNGGQGAKTVKLPTGETVQVPQGWTPLDVQSRWGMLKPQPEENLTPIMKSASEAGVPVTKNAYQDSARIQKLLTEMVDVSDTEKMAKLAKYSSAVMQDPDLNATEKKIRISNVVDSFKKAFPEISGSEKQLEEILTAPPKVKVSGTYEDTLSRFTAKRQELDQALQELRNQGVGLRDPRVGQITMEMGKVQPSDVTNYKNIMDNPSQIAEKWGQLEGLSQRYPDEPFFKQHKKFSPGFINFNAKIGGEPEDKILKGSAQYGVTPKDIKAREKLESTPLEEPVIKSKPVPSKMKVLEPSPGFEAKMEAKIKATEPEGVTTPLNLKKERVAEIMSPEQYGEGKVKSNVMGEGAYNAAPTKSTAEKIFNQEQRAYASEIKKNFKTEATQAMAESRANLEEDLEGVADAIRKSTKGVGTNVENMKDLSYLRIHHSDLDRNFQRVYGAEYPQMYQQYVKPLYDSAGQYARSTVDDANQIWDIVEKTGIKPGTKQAEAIMDYGEGKMTLEELQKKFPREWEGIVEADKGFRSYYDTKLKQVNDVLKKIYPNTWEEHIIPYRKDYYRHMWNYETGWAGLKNILENPANINPELIGVSDYTEPKTKFMSFSLKREGKQGFVKDPFLAAINYDKAANYAINIDPHISRYRSLAADLADATNDMSKTPGKMNNFVLYLRRFADDLAGKTNPLDRSGQEALSRPVQRALDAFNGRVKMNTVMGNVSSSLSQFANVPQGIADAGLDNSAKGIADYTKQLLRGVEPDDAITKSNFLTERYMDSAFDRFEPGILNDAKHTARWMLQALDEAGTKIVWNSEYEKALKQGLPDAIDYADQMTARVVARRGIGGVPLAQKSRFVQLFAPFQVELNNQWLLMKDWVDAKQFGKIATFFVLSHLFNKGYKEVTGRPVLFDPIQGVIEAVKTKNPLRVGGEVVGNLPFAQPVAEIYPEYGFKNPITGKNVTPPRSEVFGETPAIRYGSGLLPGLLTKGIQDPIFKLLFPFGGGQVEKTLQGARAYGEGAVTTGDGKVRYPVEQNLSNLIRMLLFGQYSTPEARRYFEEGLTPLGVKQSEKYKQGGGTDYYEQVIEDRKNKKEGGSTSGGGRSQRGGSQRGQR